MEENKNKEKWLVILIIINLVLLVTSIIMLVNTNYKNDVFRHKWTEKKELFIYYSNYYDDAFILSSSEKDEEKYIHCATINSVIKSTIYIKTENKSYKWNYNITLTLNREDAWDDYIVDFDLIDIDEYMYFSLPKENYYLIDENDNEINEFKYNYKNEYWNHEEENVESNYIKLEMKSKDSNYVPINNYSYMTVLIKNFSIFWDDKILEINHNDGSIEVILI